jgi:ribosome-binding ATPase YchF (GTP1/OBG family)
VEQPTKTVTTGYDPINDIDWLESEIHAWIFNNLYKRWDNIVRRHTATKSMIADTLQAQFSGYGTNKSMVNIVLDRFGCKDSLESWDKDTVSRLVDFYIQVRFPTIIALNKIDLPDSDKNIDRISRKYPRENIVLISALAENFLRTLQKQEFIKYEEGTEFFKTSEDDINLKPMD